MNDAQFNELSQKIGMLARLSALQMIKDIGYREQVALLDRIGMSRKEISEIVGKSENNISVTLHLIRKSGGTKND